MKKNLVFICVCIGVIIFASFIGGCGEDNAVTIRTENRLNMSRLSIGMTKSQVLELMGGKSAKASFGKNTVGVTNPYRSELRQVNSKTYEVLYYYTHQDQKDWPGKRFKILERELTPIIFDEGKVVGWGTEFLQLLK